MDLESHLQQGPWVQIGASAHLPTPEPVLRLWTVVQATCGHWCGCSPLSRGQASPSFCGLPFYLLKASPSFFLPMASPSPYLFISSSSPQAQPDGIEREGKNRVLSHWASEGSCHPWRCSLRPEFPALALSLGCRPMEASLPSHCA